MSVPPPTSHPGAVGARATGPGLVLAALSVVAIAAQCYGLYRPDGPPQFAWLPAADKFGHLLGFAVPVALVLVTLRWFTGAVSRRARLVVVIAFGAQAVLSELVQGHAALAGRSGEVADLVADAVGIAIGVCVAYAVGRRQHGRELVRRRDQR